MYKTTNKKT